MHVSVVVPLHNKGKYVIRALDSIVAQTFVDFEVIVVDDGSTDNSGELARAYPDERIRVIVQSNRGPGAARNRGIAEAKGHYVAFLDADDEWMPEYLEISVRRLDELGPSVASLTSGYIEYPRRISSEAMWRRRGLQDGLQTLPEPSNVLALQYMSSYMSPCSTVIRTSVVRKHGGFFDHYRCTYGEDAALSLQILLHECVYFQMRPLICFHREASDLSANYTRPRTLEPFLTNPGGVLLMLPRGTPSSAASFPGFACLQGGSDAGVLG